MMLLLLFTETTLKYNLSLFFFFFVFFFVHFFVQIKEKPVYLGGGGGQLPPQHCCHRTGPDRLGFLPVCTRTGFGSRWTEAKTRARTWGLRSPPLLATAHVRRRAASRGPRRARGFWLKKRIGSEHGGKEKREKNREEEKGDKNIHVRI